MYYDRKGKPISVDEWLSERRSLGVARTEIGDIVVSTVHLGLDHSHGASVPLIFETMVFPACKDCQRYATEEEAKAGHEAVVARYS